jgi:hypothetical protein
LLYELSHIKHQSRRTFLQKFIIVMPTLYCPAAPLYLKTATPGSVLFPYPLAGAHLCPVPLTGTPARVQTFSKVHARLRQQTAG